jgi:gluconate:H+ symporter, GntP family
VGAGTPAVVSGTQMLVGLGIGMVVLVFLILETRIHAFLALIIAAALTGIIGGMAAPAVVSSITTGFGSTLGTIGIVIGFGVMPPPCSCPSSWPRSCA